MVEKTSTLTSCMCSVNHDVSRARIFAKRAEAKMFRKQEHGQDSIRWLGEYIGTAALPYQPDVAKSPSVCQNSDMYAVS